MLSRFLLFIFFITQNKLSDQFSCKYSRLSRCNPLFESKVNEVSTLCTRDEIEEYAKSFGLRLETIVNGPVLQINVYPEGNSNPIGYLSGFLRFGLLHLDKIQVKNRRQWIGYKRDGWTIKGRGITFLLGMLALNFGMERGCSVAELLAVKDDEKMHSILVRLYESFGYEIVREVGDDWVSVPDRLVWGAVGTLMKLDIKKAYLTGTSEIREYLEKFRSSSSNKESL